MVEKKKVLIVAYHFPPDASVGAMRPQKFVKYLPEFGWQPYVLTIKDKYIQKIDSARLRVLKDVSIFRTAFFRPPLEFLLSLRNKVFSKGGVVSAAGNSGSTHSAVSGKTSIGPLKKFIVEFSKFPDDKMWWLFPALIKGYEIVRKYRIGVIYCTSPPHSVDIIGMALAKLTGCKLIVDHRDPWAACQDRTELWPIRSWHSYFEKLVLNTASAILTTTERYAMELGRFFPEHKHKIFSILNGFDSSDFESQANRTSDKFVVTYVGSFYLDRSPEFFLKAVRQLVEEDRDIKGRLEINLVGFSGGFGSHTLEDLIAENCLNDVVNVTGTVPYQESLKYVLRSNLLLLFAPNQPLQIPAKTFEYIAAKIPILAFTEEGATADIISKFRAGLVVPQDDVAAIKNAIKSVYTQSVDFYSGVDVSALERRTLTQDLVKIIEGLT